MEYAEIAKRTGTTEAAVRRMAARALRKIKRAGNARLFATVVRLSDPEEREKLTRIRCGSIECRPEKWGFYQ